jgi:hypothetical protein
MVSGVKTIVSILVSDNKLPIVFNVKSTINNHRRLLRIVLETFK